MPCHPGTKEVLLQVYKFAYQETTQAGSFHIFPKPAVKRREGRGDMFVHSVEEKNLIFQTGKNQRAGPARG